MTPELLNERLAEAARYALLRRLAPAIRHDMAGVLQPISMMAAMLEKRLQKPAPDLQALSSNSAGISTMSREAASECMSLMTWVAPKENKPVALNAGIEEAISLLNTEMSFRGFTLVNQTSPVMAELPISVVRGPFMAALLALTDIAESPANVVLGATLADGGVDILITVVAAEGETSPGSLQAYRQLEWDDVIALAGAEQVELVHSTSQAELRYRFPV